MDVFEVADYFPPVNVKGLEKLQRAIYNLGVPLDARKWLSFSLFSSLIFSILLYTITSNVSIPIVFLLISFFTLLYYPLLKNKQIEAEMEAELPLFLRDLGTLLSMDIPFLKSLEILSNKKGYINNELKRALREIKKGSSITKALVFIAETRESTLIKRAFANIISAYEQGEGGEGLKKLGTDMLRMQKQKLKEHASKSSLYSLVFLMFAVIGPTFFLLLSMVGPIMFDETPNVLDMSIILLTIFPIFSYFIIALAKSTTPRSAFIERQKTDVKALLLVFLLSAVFFLDIPFEWKLAISFILALALLPFYLKEFLKRKKIDELEKQLPNALLVASAMPKGSHITKIFEAIAKANLGDLSKEFQKAMRLIKHHGSVDDAIHYLKSLPSELLSRVIEVIDYSFKAGGNLSERLAELADDLLLFFDLKREQRAVLSMQKYSIIFSTLLLPVVISISINLISQMANSMNASVDINFVKEKTIPTYMIILSFLIANYSAFVDGERSNSILYLGVFSFITLLAYYFLGVKG